MSVRQHYSVLSRTHGIPQMEYRQIHCDHQRADNQPCHNQQQWLQKRSQIVCLLKCLFRMVAGKVRQHHIKRTSDFTGSNQLYAQRCKDRCLLKGSPHGHSLLDMFAYLPHFGLPVPAFNRLFHTFQPLQKGDPGLLG